MSDVETADAPLTAAELAALNAGIARQLHDRASLAARVEPDEALPPARRRKPLGLRPAADAPAAEARPPASEDHFADPAINLIVEANELTLGLIETMRAHFAGKLAGLENTIGALKNENQALRLILENLRITQRGERGLDGDRGPPGAAGRDGLQGQIGPRGEPGERGRPAAKITAWTIADDEFTATPVMSDGGAGATLYLRGLFESYHNAVSHLEDADLVEAARESRAESDRQAERSRWTR